MQCIVLYVTLAWAVMGILDLCVSGQVNNTSQLQPQETVHDGEPICVRPHCYLTHVFIGANELTVPQLDSEAWRQPPLSLAQTVEVLLLLHHHDLLLGEILKGKHKTPVKVSLSTDTAVMDISLLWRFFSLHPTAREVSNMEIMR